MLVTLRDQRVEYYCRYMNTRGMTGKHGGLSVDLLDSRLKGTGLSPS